MKKKIYDIVFASQYEGLSTKEATDQLLVLFGVIKSVCPNPECKSKNITHTETYSYCEDCRRMFNGQNVL